LEVEASLVEGGGTQMFEEVYVALRYGRILIKGGGMHEI
jgi:hypothetical protein